MKKRANIDPTSIQRFLFAGYRLVKVRFKGNVREIDDILKSNQIIQIMRWLFIMNILRHLKRNGFK